MQEEVRVVVVDDNAEAADTLAEVLRLSGYAVRTAADGPSGLQLIDEYDPQCVLLDIHLPGIDGREVARKARERHGQDIVLIAISGGSTGKLRTSASFDSFDYYLGKPFDFDMLQRLLPRVSD